MKLINLFVLLLGISCSSSSQHTCQLDEIIVDFLNTDISYSVDKEYVDLTNVFKDNQTTYIGFFGENKEKLDFCILSIERDLKNPFLYKVKGETKIYTQKPKPFVGEFLLDKQYRFSEKLDEDISYVDKILKQGFSILTYKLRGDSKLQNTGVFEGHILVSWYLDILGNVNYDNTLDYYPNYSNCQFFGSWTAYNNGKQILTGWGQYRVLCSGDLDVGASEFSPNPKYYTQGWEGYNSELPIKEEVNQGERVFAKIVDEDGYVNMRKGKENNAEIILQIQSDSIVKVLNKNEDWWLVSYKDLLGYVHKSRLKIVEEGITVK